MQLMASYPGRSRTLRTLLETQSSEVLWKPTWWQNDYTEKKVARKELEK